ncbi:hypothetical protein C4K17_2636 [Pseudomonas chlororaphis subsp. aurantiaca]|nr:hypothetical protein C4K17_2636 [Pseudomonas chlororaphis subsp. aurantiaca]
MGERPDRQHFARTERGGQDMNDESREQGEPFKRLFFAPAPR